MTKSRQEQGENQRQAQPRLEARLKSNPDHIEGRPGLSPLHHPSFPNNPGNFFIEKKFTVNFRSGYKLVLSIILSFKLSNYSIINAATRFQNFSFLNYRNLPQNFFLNSSMNFSRSSLKLSETSTLIKSSAKAFNSFLCCSALGPTRTAQVSIFFSYVKK